MHKPRPVPSTGGGVGYDDYADDAEPCAAYFPGVQKKSRSSLLIDAVFPNKELPASAKSSRDPAPVLVTGARIPMEFWASGWLFKAVGDILWRSITRNSANIFPATLREDHETHPAYVTREIGNYGVEICPLTTRQHKTPHIPAGRKLDSTGFVWDKTSYLVLRAASRLPRNNGIFPDLPQFLGILPPEELER